LRSLLARLQSDGSANLSLPAGAPPLFLVKAGGEYKALPLVSELKLDPSP
jgi:hypothetical protein